MSDAAAPAPTLPQPTPAPGDIQSEAVPQEIHDETMTDVDSTTSLGQDHDRQPVNMDSTVPSSTSQPEVTPASVEDDNAVPHVPDTLPNVAGLASPPLQPPTPLDGNAPPQPPVDSNDGDGDGDTDTSSNSDDEDGASRIWREIPEDTTTPDERELKDIEESGEKNALDHKHWEGLTFTECTDPEYTPQSSGRIDWTINNYNGTKDKPNHETVMRSPVVNIGGHDWRIKFYPRGNETDYLSVYLECCSLHPTADGSSQPANQDDGNVDTTFKAGSKAPFDAAEPTHLHIPLPLLDSNPVIKRKAISAQVSVVLYNPAEPRVHFFRSAAHKFCTKNPDWGWTRFHGPYYEISFRHRGQRQALLRNDSLAFSAYLRLVNDETDCLYEHPSKDNPYDSFAMTGLQGLGSPIGTFNGGSLISVIAPWMLLRPFRQLLYGFQAPDLKVAGSRPAPVMVALQSILLKLRTKPTTENPFDRVSLNDLSKAFDWYGIEKNFDTYDAVQIADILRLKMTEECQNSPLISRLDQLFGSHKGTNQMWMHRVPVKDVHSVQKAVDRCPYPSQPDADYPEILHIEFKRQTFDDKRRAWEKLKHKVQLEDHLQVSTIPYTLYGMITHSDDIQSGNYFPVLRPNGPGGKWFAYKDARGSNHVSCMSKKEVARLFGGESTAVAYIALYVRDDIASKVFDNSGEPFWDLKQLHTSLSDYHYSSADAVIPYINDKTTVAKQSSVKKSVTAIAIDSTSFCSYEGAGFVDPLGASPASSKNVYRINLGSDITLANLRSKLTSQLPHVEDPRQIKIWSLDPLAGNELTPTLRSVEKSFPAQSQTQPGSQLDESPIDQSRQLSERIPLRFWFHVVRTNELPPLPPPVKEALKVIKTDDAGEGPSTSNETTVVGPDGVPAIQPSENAEDGDTPMMDNDEVIDEEAVLQRTVTTLSDSQSLNETPMSSGSGENAVNSGASQPPVASGQLSTAAEISEEKMDAERVYVFVKIFDVEQQTLKGKCTFFAKRSSRIDHAIQKSLRLSREQTANIYEETGIGSASILKRRRTFGEDRDSSDRSVILILRVNAPNEDEALESTTSSPGLFTDIPTFLAHRALIRNFPASTSGDVTYSYFSKEFYTGAAKAGLPHGSGTKIYHSGDTYTGSFSLGARRGHGLMIYANGDKYEGDWADGQKHGHGMYKEAESGNTYTGGWKADKKFGEGVTQWRRAEESERLCRICWDEPADAVFFDCGHVVACLSCGRRVEQCPVCRKRVASAFRFYLAT